MIAVEDSIVLQCQNAGCACEGCDSVCHPWNKHADCQGDVRRATESHMPQLPQCHHLGETSKMVITVLHRNGEQFGTQCFLESKLQNCAVPEFSISDYKGGSSQ